MGIDVLQNAVSIHVASHVTDVVVSAVFALDDDLVCVIEDGIGIASDGLIPDRLHDHPVVELVAELSACRFLDGDAVDLRGGDGEAVDGCGAASVEVVAVAVAGDGSDAVAVLQGCVSAEPSADGSRLAIALDVAGVVAVGDAEGTGGALVAADDTGGIDTRCCDVCFVAYERECDVACTCGTACQPDIVGSTNGTRAVENEVANGSTTADGTKETSIVVARDMEVADAVTLSVEGAPESLRVAAYRPELAVVAFHVDVGFKVCVAVLRSFVDYLAELNELLRRRDIVSGVCIKGARIIAQVVVNPCQASRNVVSQDTHFCIVGTECKHILMNLLVQDGPTDEVEIGRSLHLMFHAVHVCDKRLLVE